MDVVLKKHLNASLESQNDVFEQAFLFDQVFSPFSLVANFKWTDKYKIISITIAYKSLKTNPPYHTTLKEKKNSLHRLLTEDPMLYELSGLNSKLLNHEAK